MTDAKHVAVIDIGKTNAKLALVDLDRLEEIAVVTRPNTVQSGPPWPHFDVEGHWTFLLQALGEFHRKHRVDAISVTTHGASIVLLDRNGGLAAPVLDYEHSGPDEFAAEYDAIRPSFAHTGSPRLAGGLNVGAQLHWQFRTDPTLRDRTETIVTYPQYWGHRLTGCVASDVTSIGCHTDLWEPQRGRFSSLVAELGIAGKIAPVRKSADVLGTIRPDIAQQTGLPAGIPVAVGIHDSNASLYPHVLSQVAPYSVVSTGTWVIVMTMGGADVGLDDGRDTLMNVNALGQAVPSARFMGGREYALIQGEHAVHPTVDDVAAVLDRGIMLLPAVEPTSGPFQGQQAQWSGAIPAEGTGIRAAALAFYLAMMTETCLQLTGANGSTIVEGPFARNADYLDMLAAASGRPVLRAQSATGTSIGAALLFADGTQTQNPAPFAASANTSRLAEYAHRWRDACASLIDPE